MVYDPASLDSSAVTRFIRQELDKLTPTAGKRAYEGFMLAALSAIPWAGSFISTVASINFQDSELRTLQLLRVWLEAHEKRLNELSLTFSDVFARFESFGDEIEERIQSEEYLSLVRSAFRVWDSAETEEKRRYARNIIVNAAGSTFARDDFVRLFIDLLDALHEAHLGIVRHLYHQRSATRREIWLATSSENRIPREDSAEADLFRKLIRDLSTGDLIRQRRDVTPDGQFLEKERRSTSKEQPRETWNGRRISESSFDGEDVYVLTSLGEQFVHYVLNEAIQIEHSASN